MLPRHRVIDPVRWIEHLDLVESMVGHLTANRQRLARVTTTEPGPLSLLTALARMRAGLAVVADGESLWNTPVWPQYAVLEPSGAVDAVTPVERDGELIDFRRADGTMVGYGFADAPTVIAEVAGNARNVSDGASDLD
jgi:hypothetical protein